LPDALRAVALGDDYGPGSVMCPPGWHTEGCACLCAVRLAQAGIAHVRSWVCAVRLGRQVSFGSVPAKPDYPCARCR